MAKSSNQKLKLLYLLKMLEEKTDEENTMTINDMIAELDRYGITAERKSIYDDLEALRHYGLDIATRKSKTTDYFVAGRLFELPELKLLVDAVQCSKFVTHKKSNELIKKIESLASNKQAQSLHRQVYVSNRVKTINESIYYNVDKLHAAIAENKQVSFKYFDYDIKKEKVYRKNGDKYTVSPYGLSWDDENYYLITFATKYNAFTHYRVDRMTDIDLLNEIRNPLPNKKIFDIAEYTKKVFNMFSGEEVYVRIQFDNSIVNAVVDRFGKDIVIGRIDEANFYICIKVAVSSTFFAWITQFGNKVKVIHPEAIVIQYKNFLEDIIMAYDQ
jgi:predicted DNA-binding transcriptional regulator YafY